MITELSALIMFASSAVAFSSKASPNIDMILLYSPKVLFIVNLGIVEVVSSSTL
jgi:hypothetical protein